MSSGAVDSSAPPWISQTSNLSSLLSSRPSPTGLAPWVQSLTHQDPTLRPLTSLPNLNLLEHPATSVAAAVQSAYTAQPAPFGVSDFGLGASTYSYNTSHFLGQVTFSAPPNVTDPGSAGMVDPGGAHLGFVGSMNEFSVQLNTVATNITYPGSSSGFFWTQNVVDWNDTGIHFVDDTFNFSSYDPYISYGTIYSGCNNNTSGVDHILAASGILQCVGGTIPVSPQAYPVTLQLYNNASVNAENRDQVAYGYRIVEAGLGEVFTGVSDVVVFNNPGAPATPPTTTPGFSVDGFALAPFGLLRDAELDLVGDIGGDNAVFRSINGTLNLEYSNASAGGWQNVPSAYDYGADTGETSTGIAVTWEPNGTADINQGPSMLYGLWHAVPSVSVASGSLHLEGSITPSYGFVFVSNSAPFLHPGDLSWLPTNNLGQFDTYLPPLGAPFATQYYVQGFADGSTETNGTPVTASTTGYTLVLPSSPGTLDAPLYAFSNAQAAGLALNVTGSTSVPYLFTNLMPSVNLSFDHSNDYGFPSFDTAMFQGLTNPVHVNNVGSRAEIEIFGGTDDLVTNESFEAVVLWHEVDATVRTYSVFNGTGGVFVDQSSGTTVQDGTVLGWTLHEDVGVYDVGSTGTVVDGLTVTGAFTIGIVPYSSRNATYTSINGSLGAEGILGGGFDDSTGLRNTYYDLPGVTNASISSLSVTDGSVFGVYLQASTDVSVRNVSVTGSGEGVLLDGVTNSSVAASTIDGDTYSLDLSYTNWVNVSGLELSHDTYGAGLEGATNTSITGSVFFSIVNYAVTILSSPFGAPSTRDVIYNNSFILNNGSTLAYSAARTQASSEPGNSFNLSGVGNCWADWHSIIGGVLSPYNINLSAGVADDHPLACPGPKAYLISFQETGLGAKGKSWLLGLADFDQSSGATSTTPGVSSLGLPVPNGTYTFLVVGPSGWRASDPVGSVVVAGGNVTRAETFSRGATHTLTFHETGLGQGSIWCIALGGAYEGCSDRASVAFKNLTPATYPFSIGQEQYTSATSLVKVRNAWVPETQGSITLTGSTQVNIRYAYAVYFVEEGLAPGTTWGVKVGGMKETTTGLNVSFYLINGTYKFKVLPVAGYVETPRGGQVVVSGEVMWIYLSYEPT